MSTPTQPIADARSAEVRGYVRAVRARLADLPAEDLDDLTLGMEADLAERAAESGAPLRALLGPPEVYAAELRSAAGLPSGDVASEGAPRGRWLAGLAESVEQVGTDVIRRWPWVRDLQPLWWLLRGAVLAFAVVVLLGLNVLVWVLVPLAAVASFWAGRRALSAGAAARESWTVLLNVLAVVALGWVLLLVAASAQFGTSAPMPPDSTPGVSLDGNGVLDLYVYDAEGHRVEGARIYDQDGNGLYVDPGMMWDRAGSLPTRPDGSVDVDTDVFPLVVGDRDPWAPTDGHWTPPLTLPPVPTEPTSSADASPSSSPSPSGPRATPAPTGSTAETSPPPTPTPSDG